MIFFFADGTKKTIAWLERPIALKKHRAFFQNEAQSNNAAENHTLFTLLNRRTMLRISHFPYPPVSNRTQHSERLCRVSRSNFGTQWGISDAANNDFNDFEAGDFLH